MPYLDLMDERTGFLAADAPKVRGSELTLQYQAGIPFPNITIDDFLPEPLLERFLDGFPSMTNTDLNVSYDRDQERLKSSFHPDTLSPELRAIFYSFNSRPFIRILENITGIKGLIPDPYFLGAGLHEIRQGGHLSIHADFNHHKPMNLERRINVLIYLNRDWKRAYGGQLELWNDGMSEKVHSIVPTFNRCVIFNTTSNSLHGNPEAINHPMSTSRRSIALYYYTSTWNETKRSHTTHFQVRPGTKDKRDWKIILDELKLDYLPPAAIRALGSLRRMISGGSK